MFLSKRFAVQAKKNEKTKKSAKHDDASNLRGIDSPWKTMTIQTCDEEICHAETFLRKRFAMKKTQIAKKNEEDEEEEEEEQ